MESVLSKLLDHKKELTSENLFSIIQLFSRQLLDEDTEVIEKSTWWKTVDYTTETFKSIEDYHLFEREILCLAGAMVWLLGVKDAVQICADTIEKIAEKNYGLRNAIITESLRTSEFFFEFVVERYEFYLNELLLCYEMKNPWGVGRILYYQYFPMDNIIEPKIDDKDSFNPIGIITDTYLELRFKLITAPILVQQLPKSFKSIN